MINVSVKDNLKKNTNNNFNYFSQQSTRSLNKNINNSNNSIPQKFTDKNNFNSQTTYDKKTAAMFRAASP